MVFFHMKYVFKNILMHYISIYYYNIYIYIYVYISGVFPIAMLEYRMVKQASKSPAWSSM